MGILLEIKNDMSKAEENAIIEKLEKAFDKNNNNYLASLSLQGP